MRREPYLWKHKKNDYYYVIHYDGPLGERKRMESLRTGYSCGNSKEPQSSPWVLSSSEYRCRRHRQSI